MPVQFAVVQQQRQGYGSVNNPPLPAPIGGLNTRDALENMPATDAIQLDNWFPDVKSLSVVKDYSSYATGLGGGVEFLAEYYSSTTREFIAASGDSIFDVSVGGAATLIQSGFNSPRWNNVNFNARMFLVNGEDEPQTYYGGAVSASGFTGSGLTPSNLVGVASFKSRLFFFEKDSQDFWYADLNAITGTLTKFPLSLIGRVGGNLVAIKTISRDGGSGPDDYIAFFMSSGEVFVYQGSDPGDSDAWSIVGRYKIGEPIHQRAILEYGSDILIVTNGDIVTLTDVMTKKPDEILPSKLSGAIADASRRYGSNFGWQVVYYPKGNRVLINTPVRAGTQYWQYGFNTITGSAFRFTTMNAMCFGVYNKDLYFGGNNGVVYKADAAARSNAITAIAQQAFSNLGSAASKKFTNMHCTMKVRGRVDFTVSLAFDYGRPSNAIEYSNTSVGTPWGSPWGSPWSKPGYINKDKVGAAGSGKSVSMYMEAAVTSQDITWYDTCYKYTPLTKFG